MTPCNLADALVLHILLVVRRQTFDDADEVLSKVADSLDAMQQRVSPGQQDAEAAGDG